MAEILTPPEFNHEGKNIILDAVEFLSFMKGLEAAFAIQDGLNRDLIKRVTDLEMRVTWTE